MKKILIGITSSIAAYKACELIRKFKKNGYSVKTILTKNALNFITPLTLETLSGEKSYCEQFLPKEDVEHISLADWADVFVIAPASANTISKCAQGISDNLLTSVFCAYLGKQKPVLFAPAMNEGMWNNPIICENIKKLKEYNCDFENPEIGYLACGLEGTGRLADINLIYQSTLRLLYQNKKNNNKKIIVTLGGTREKIDTVRCITNLSSGKMGCALADWAYYLGYNVCAISTKEINKPYKVIQVNTALEMLETLKKEEFDHLIMAAAVSDFRVTKDYDKKISKDKTEDIFTLELTKNPDVIKTIAQNKKENQKITGFCLADENLRDCAEKKLKDKNLDFIIANDIKTALNTDKNKVTIIDKGGKIIDINLDDKNIIARKILEVVCD